MFEYRGFLLDSVRHMQSIDEIKKLIDSLSALKFNKFHWHLTDDQGWRFECDCFPELNTVAAVRPYSDFGKTYDSNPYGRVYTKAEMKEIVSYCAERGIDVVPEFDMPGHSSALLSAMPELSCGGKEVKIKTHQGIFKDVLCLAKEKTYETVTKILDEFLEVFPCEYIHIGGDETPSKHWESCPDCRKFMNDHGITDYAEYQNCFMNRIIDYLDSKGRKCVVWNDAAKGKNLDKRAIIHYWKENHKPSIQFINNGGKAILSPFSYYYLDYDYSITPLNRVYSFSGTLNGLTEEGKKNILGVEATLWTEYIDSNTKFEEFVFPRLIAVSKTALGEKKASYKDFTNEVKLMKTQMKNIAFCNEKDWTNPRISMVCGWLKFVKDKYSIDYIKEQLS